MRNFLIYFQGLLGIEKKNKKINTFDLQMVRSYK